MGREGPQRKELRLILYEMPEVRNAGVQAECDVTSTAGSWRSLVAVSLVIADFPVHSKCMTRYISYALYETFQRLHQVSSMCAVVDLSISCVC